MQIVLNGKTFTVDEANTVESLLDKLKINGRLAVEINNRIIPQSLFHSHTIKSNDRVEIVHAIGGG